MDGEIGVSGLPCEACIAAEPLAESDAAVSEARACDTAENDASGGRTV